jgi:hypothetical protein
MGGIIGMGQTDNRDYDFDRILAEIQGQNQEYERCASIARDFLKGYPEDDPSKPLRPYAIYFKLFAQAYRTWQVSYSYHHIRNGFHLAYYLLVKELKDVKDDVSEDFKSCFSHLSSMLCSYTECENAFISNDANMLSGASAECIKHEHQAFEVLNRVKKRYEVMPVPYQHLYDWLKSYFRKNHYLHGGLNSCSHIYNAISRHRNCDPFVFKRRINDAERCLEKLQPESQELASELNAHIRHITSHYNRFLPGNVQPSEPGFIKITQGLLVLSMTASFRPECIHKIFSDNPSNTFWKDEMLDKFRQNVVTAFNKRFNLPKELPKDDNSLPRPTKFCRMKLHDIFETSFGAQKLKAIAFDLPELRIDILDKTYSFNIHFTVSALGTSTIYFTLDIGGEDNPDGLSVEEARAIQSLICPHSGQIELPADRICASWAAPDTTRVCKFKLVDRLRLFELKDDLDTLVHWFRENESKFTDQMQLKATGKINAVFKRIKKIFSNPLTPSPRELVKEIEKGVDKIIEVLLNSPNDIECCLNQLEVDIKHIAGGVEKLLDALCLLKETGVERDEIEIHMSKLRARFNTFYYIYDVAQMHLDSVRDALIKMIVSDNDTGKRERNRLSVKHLKSEYGNAESLLSWKLISDSGWHSYLHVSELEIVYSTFHPGDRVMDFSKIITHPDTIGLIKEQREARASFDDWRFLVVDRDELWHENLAHIRSHTSDAFYVSEFQSFLFMPDDPNFLMDQYEATVDLMIRISNKLKGYNIIVDEYALMPEFKGDLLNKEIREVNDRLMFLAKLHGEAKELRNLALKASISRYKDHAELMSAMVNRMNINQLTRLLDQHIGDLQTIYARNHDDLISRRNASMRRLMPIATLCLAISGLSVFSSSCLDVADLLRPKANYSTHEVGLITLILMVIALVGILIFYDRDINKKY